jgi:sensor histidine kinase YesM
LQPYVENAIVHGLRYKKSGAGIVALYMKKETDHVSIVIDDNGIGRTKAKEFSKHNSGTHQSIGLNVTGKRIELLKLTNGEKISISITDLHEGEEPGTRVSIQLPLQFKFK